MFASSADAGDGSATRSPKFVCRPVASRLDTRLGQPPVFSDKLPFQCFYFR